MEITAKFEKRNSSYIVVDAETYYVNRGKEKTLSIWSFVKYIVFKFLAEFGVCCERVVLKGVKIEDLTTVQGIFERGVGL